MHFEQPSLALWPTKPHSFLVAGMSDAQHVNAAQTQTFFKGWYGHLNITPNQSSFNSSTKGYRNELIVSLGSLGPGINPTSITFCFL